MSNNQLRIIIAGGGTGGHIFPGLAIAGSLKKLDNEVRILWVGANGKMEMQRVPDAGYDIQGIDIAGFNRSSLVKNLGLPVKLVKSYFQVRRILKSFHPDGVVGVGGYSSLPVLRVAQAQHIPTFIHESNSLPGKSNLILGKRAEVVFVATDEMEKYFRKEKLVVSGNPVREAISRKADKKEALSFFGLSAEHKTVLAVGGSLGAKSINDTLCSNLSFWQSTQTQLIWQTGKNFTGARMVPGGDNKWIWRDTFIDRMDMAYGAADLVIARAGAMTIAELKTQGKASILVPYPYAAEDHQTVNARQLTDRGAAAIVADADLKGKLIPQVELLLSEPEKIKAMEAEAAGMARPDADITIARKILEKINKKEIK